MIAKRKDNVGKTVLISFGGPWHGKTGVVVGWRGSDFASVRVGRDIFPMKREHLTIVKK